MSNNPVDGQYQDGKAFAICRAHWPGDKNLLIPGKFYSSKCNIAYDHDGAEILVSSGDVEILTCVSGCSDLKPPWTSWANEYWRWSTHERSNLVEAGIEHVGTPYQRPVYVCTGSRNDIQGWHSGKFVKITVISNMVERKGWPNPIIS